MADRKDYENPFSQLGRENPPEDEQIHPRIHAQLRDLLDDLGLQLDGNQMTPQNQTEKKDSTCQTE